MAVNVTVLMAADVFKRTAEVHKNAGKPRSIWRRIREAIVAKIADWEEIARQ